MYFMSDPQALHVTRNVIPGKLGVDLHLHRVHIPLVIICLFISSSWYWHNYDIIAIFCLLHYSMLSVMKINI